MNIYSKKHANVEKDYLFDEGIFIVGVRKCGTTSLFDVLAKHSEIAYPKHKEPQFFCLSKDTVTSGIKWYKNLFRKKKGIHLDGSTLYYQYPESYDEINHYFRNPKYILCLRDPAKRLYSAYWHMKSKPQNIEKRTLNHILQKLQGNSTEEILTKEKSDLVLSAINKQIDINYLNENYHNKDMMAPLKTTGIDPLSFYEYYRESIYSLNFDDFQKQKNTHIVFFENLLRSPETELKKLHSFLNLEMEESTSQLYENINKTMTAEDSWIMKSLGKTPIYKYLKSKFNGQVKYKIKKILYKNTPDMTEKEYDNIRALLKEEYAFWEKKYPEVAKIWKF